MRQSLIVAAAIVLGSLLIGLLLSGGSTGQAPAAPGVMPDRYKAKMVQMTPAVAKVLLYDTATGHCWIYNSGGGAANWHDLGVPSEAAQPR